MSQTSHSNSFAYFTGRYILLALIEKKMTDQSRQESRQESNIPLPPVGRARGLLAIW